MRKTASDGAFQLNEFNPFESNDDHCLPGQSTLIFLPGPRALRVENHFLLYLQLKYRTRFLDPREYPRYYFQFVIRFQPLSQIPAATQ